MEEYLYSAFWPRWYTRSAQAWITQFYLQITPYLPVLRERSPDVTITATEAADIQLQLTTHLSTPKDERLSWPSWLTYSGWFTHISGHPSATGRTQDSKSTPAKDRSSTAGPRNRRVGNSLPYFIRDQAISTNCFRRVLKHICSLEVDTTGSASSALGTRDDNVPYKYSSSFTLMVETIQLYNIKYKRNTP